jgi:long-chain acyl-CoA synthetase
MSFLGSIFSSLENKAGQVVLQELRDGNAVAVTARELLNQVAIARAYVRRLRLKKGDRCALLAHNSIEWVAMDLAIMAEGLIVVPLYARQAAPELVAMMKDCWPSVICCGEQSLASAIVAEWPDSPPYFCFDKVFVAGREPLTETPVATKDEDVVTIIYTSGTSGDAKGVTLNSGNIAHMLGRTSGRLDRLMDHASGPDSVFHYLPFCFAGSWIMLLTCLLRGSRLTLNTDLSKLAGDMRASAPDYFLNVPALLERMRRGIDEQLWKTGGFVLKVYSKAKGAWVRKQERTSLRGDGVWLAAARQLVFPTIRRKMLGNKLRALICGSAPLSVETQLYFMMLGIPVLQVYGLTETTAICTMDDPKGRVVPGRVGPAIEGIEIRLGANEEILVRGPNIFPGYWARPQETAKVLRDGWFYTGDQGELDDQGNWKIVGRIKNLIILASGHNIAPEPIEDQILEQLPDATQVLVIGNARAYLTALITGKVNPDQVQSALDEVNSLLPHYKQVRGFHIVSDPFTIESGLLTANGKLKRDAIAQTFNREIDRMYQARTGNAGAPEVGEMGSRTK